MLPLILAGINLAAGVASKRKAKKREQRDLAQRMSLATPMATRAQELRSGPARTGLTNLQGLATRALIAGRQGDLREAQGQNSADVAIAAGRGPTSLPGVFDRAMTRARGLSRLARHTSDTFDNTLMRERLGAVTAGRARQTTGLQGVLDSVGLRAGTLAAGQASRELGAATRENIYGSVMGMGVGAIPDIQAWNQRRRSMNASEFGAGGTPNASTERFG